MRLSLILLLTIFVLAALLPARSEPGDFDGFGLSFKPDYIFDGSSLQGCQQIGAIHWEARDGEIAGKGESEQSAGLLVFSKSYQDVGMHLLLKCDGSTQAGMVCRMEKTSEGFKGLLVTLKDGEMSSCEATFDSKGALVSRLELRGTGNNPLVRIAPASEENFAPSNRKRGNTERRASETRSPFPLVRPNTSFRSNEWNQVELFLDVNIIRCFLNDGGPSAVGAVADGSGNFGSIALYVAGQGEVRFKDFKCKDLARRITSTETTSPHFRAQRISDMYYSWGMAAGDFNRDGALDVVAGPYIYYGPGFTNHSEIFPAIAFNPSKEFTDINCEYVFDFNGDGWPDVLTGPPKSILFLNPKDESRRWTRHVVIPSIQSEVTVFKDLDKSGVPALIFCAGGVVRYAKPDPADPTRPWPQHIVSEPGYALGHGLGVGDINGDGRLDIVNGNGWWEQPADRDAGSGPWNYHPVAFARYGHRASGAGGAVMGIYDVNGDGLNDVVTALNAHGFGLAWFEQKRNTNGVISFARHMICDDYGADNAGGVTFSEPHGSTFADLDGDGVPDFIVGKRYWSHLDTYFDPDPYGDPVLYCYHTVSDPKASGKARFVPELIHNRSGAGSDILAVDLNGDGLIDVVTSTDRGTFIFWNLPTDPPRSR